MPSGSSALPIPTNLRDYILKYEGVNLNDTVPAATGGKTNVTWKSDEFGNISASVAGGGGTPGGSSEQIQYNQGGSFAGAAGGTTDGDHWALGAGSEINNPDPSYWDESTILNITETTNDPAGRQALVAAVHWLPTSTVGSQDGTEAIGAELVVNMDGQSTANCTIAAVSGIVDITSNTTALSSAQGLFSWVRNRGTASLTHLFGAQGTCSNEGGGTVSNDQIGVLGTAVVQGGSHSETLIPIYSDIAGVNASTINWYAGVFVAGPAFTNGGTANAAYGIRIDPISGATGNWQLYSAGTAPSFFAGPVQVARLDASVVYSAAGTPLPTPTMDLLGARAVVSDATVPTFLGTYTSGGAVVSPVMCNGTDWVTA